MTLSPLKTQRRDRLLAAAQTYFLTHGLRAATMEGIAAAAGLSKVTLYSYFPDRDAVFAATVARLLAGIEAAALAALDGTGTPADRALACLIAKHGPLRAILTASPFAADLMADGHALAATHAMDARLIDALASLTGDRASAHVLFHAAIGVAASPSVEGLNADLARLVRAFV